MEYTAYLTREGRRWLAEFPDAPGCQTFADSRRDLESAAEEALEGWLEAHLIDGQVPPVAKKRRLAPAGRRLLRVPVDSQLAVAVRLRWARARLGMTQAELAKRAGVSQQQVAKLERPGSNPTVETLDRLAKALGAKLEVLVA